MSNYFSCYFLINRGAFDLKFIRILTNWWSFHFKMSKLTCPELLIVQIPKLNISLSMISLRFMNYNSQLEVHNLKMTFFELILNCFYLILFHFIKYGYQFNLNWFSRFWGIKYLLFIGMTVGAFFIPDTETFGYGNCNDKI